MERISSYRGHLGLHTSDHHRCSGIFHSVYWYIFHVLVLCDLSCHLCQVFWRNVELSKIGEGTVEVHLGRSLCLSLAEIDLFLGLCLCRSSRRSLRSIRPSERCLDSARWSWSLCLSRAVCFLCLRWDSRRFCASESRNGCRPRRVAVCLQVSCHLVTCLTLICRVCHSFCLSCRRNSRRSMFRRGFRQCSSGLSLIHI